MDLKKLTRERKTTPNVIRRDWAGWEQGAKALRRPKAIVEAWVQSLIDEIDDHFHLREAKLLILGEAGIKASNGRICMGKASKASGLVRFLAKGDGGDGAALRVEPDFVIRLNAETWDADNDRKCLGLIDHELMHCGVTIAGTYADRKALVGKHASAMARCRGCQSAIE